MKVVVTGFQPFGKEEMNPSFEAVRLLPDEICGAQIVKEEIPVVFRKGGKTVHVNCPLSSRQVKKERLRHEGLVPVSKGSQTL